ncbi:MFS transporter [Alteromonas sp. KUL49]|uniref:MFS transporter n=1 Tax=Alteromonas sp. KUL49 TaxID=2480798 RepID=UPI00102EE93A|nr:MFS transporter [Alteromonas sp. KUL49]TAP35826.1 MFS transporter [Alteromonas sp. KUL49]GEA13203.1 MFS transporter [Alteromonas sp. KUL49]
MNTRQIIASAIIVALGGFIFGLDAALISGTVKFITLEFGLSDLEVGAVVSAPGFGVLFALLVTGQICNKYGRRLTLIVISFLYIFSAIFSVVANSFETLVAARFIGGLAFTSLSVAAMYIGEIAPPNLRGKLVSMIQINIVVGLSSAYFANYGIVQLSQSDASWVSAISLDTATWRWMLAVEIVPAIVWFALLFRIPRSPRWLVMQGREEEALRVIHQFMPSEQAQSEIDGIKQSLIKEGGKASSIKDALGVLISGPVRTAAIIGVTIAIVQQITGINAIMFYAPTVFEQVGIGSDAAFFQAVVVGLVSTVFTALAIALIDRLGRRPLIVWGLAWAALSLLACYIGFENATYMLNADAIAQLSASVNNPELIALQDVVYESDIAFKQALQQSIGAEAAREFESVLLQAATSMNATLVLVGISSFIAAFHFSIGPVMWVLFSEIFPTSVRGIAIPAFALIASIVSYLVQQFFPWQLNNMGAADIFLFYTICGVIGFVILYRLMPETKNKSIEEIEAFFAEKRPA